MLFTKFLLGMAFAAMLTTGVANTKTQNSAKAVDEIVEEKVTAKRQTRSSGPQRLVSADLRWTDEQGIAHPLVGAKVNLHDPDVFSPNYYTDSTGHVEIIYDYYDYDQDLYLKVSAQNDTANIKVQTKQGVLYTYDFQVNIMIDDYIDYTFTTAVEGDFDRALNVYQAAYYYGMYAKNINHGTAMPMCTFNWPGSTDEGCYYTYNSITISGKTPATGYPSAWASWDVIGHEYGHHVQRTKGITANPGGTHYINHNNIDDQMFYNGYTIETAKNRGLKLAWGEGWPTFWSTIAQSTFPTDIKNIATVGDTRYTTYQGFWYELDSYDAITTGSMRAYHGDADEIAVQSILYKLYSPTIDTYDKFAISVQTLFDIVCDAQPYTFYEFMEAMYDAGYNEHNLGKLLSKYKITPTSIDISGNYVNLPATFSWSTDKGSTNLRYNQFDFVVLRPNYTELFRVNNISATGNTAYYTPTVNQWSQILSLGTGYYVYVVSRQTLSFTSGNYVSELFSFDQPTEYFNGDSVMHPANWGFRQQYYFDGQTATHIVDDFLTINSSRLRCGYIEQSYIVLSAKHKDAGHAYLSLEFSRPVYYYSFDVALWSDSEGINANNAELVMQVKGENGNWVEIVDLLNDITLPTKDQGFYTYENWADEGIYGMRWLETAPATGTKNKGRIAFDEILFNVFPG